MVHSRRKEAANALPVDVNYDVVIVVPTVAHRETLIPTVRRLVADAAAERERPDPVRVAIVLSVNGPDPEEARQVVAECCEIAGPAGVRLLVEFADRPIGFSAANNRGLMASIRAFEGCAELVVFHNDDAHVPVGFARRMLGTVRSEVVHGYSEHFGSDGRRPDRAASAYGRVGLVGPLSNLVAGIQQITELDFPDGRKATWRGNVEAFDQAVVARFEGQKVTTDFLSGFCVGLSREAIADLMLYRYRSGCALFSPTRIAGALAEAIDAGGVVDRTADADAVGPWDEDGYPIAGYEDNDLCVRAELLGWRCLVASDLFVGHVGHQTFDRLFPEAMRGMRNRVAYYERWRHMTRPEGGPRVGAVFRLRFEVAHDIQLFRLAVARASELCDSVSICLTSNPLDVVEDRGWREERTRLRPEDDAMLRACDKADAETVGEVLRRWVAGVVADHAGSRLGKTVDEVAERVAVAVWTGSLDERAERNRSIELAEERFDPTWILSIDHDEVVENRVTREHLDRLCSHPDPLVRAYDQAWVNHWDSERLYRVDRPWGDGGSWLGGMHGYRLFRVSGRRIFAGTSNGLHCGNVPDHDAFAKRISNVRFRHFGYLRAEDRIRKHERYRVQDPNPDPLLTGNAGRDAYGHIVYDVEMTVSPFFSMTGIGLHVLMHPGETANDLARVLDQLHGLADRVVLVWTAAWTDEDRATALLPAAPEELARQAERDDKIVVYEAWMADHAEDNAGRKPTRPPRLRAAQRTAQQQWVHRPLGFAPATGPSVEVLAVAEAFGAEWVHQPLANNLAAARNAGLDALSARAFGMGWALFVDLDEFWSDPFADLVAVRRMADAPDTDAWLFSFVNAHADGTATRSESYRMARLLPNMRLAGRVHETYDASLEAIDAGGRVPRVRVAPFEVQHYGLAKGDEEMDRKLARYRDLLLLELRDKPYNAGAWVALGLALENDGGVEQAEECYKRAVLCPAEGYLAPREYAMYLLRRAVPFLALALERSKGSAWAKVNEPLCRYLLTHVPPLPLLGSARTGAPREIVPVELPAFSPPEDLGLIIGPDAGGGKSR